MDGFADKSMGSPVSAIVVSLYMNPTPSHWFRYVDNTRVEIKSQDVQALTKHNNSVDGKNGLFGLSRAR